MLRSVAVHLRKRIGRTGVETAVVVVSLGSVVYGVALVYEPAAWLVAGGGGLLWAAGGSNGRDPGSHR